MINLPLPCKILLKTSTDVNTNVNTYTAGSVQNIEGISPNLLSEKITLEYPMLTINELAYIEEIFDSTKGVERISWEGRKWTIDEYDSGYYPQYSLKVALTKVG
jgi:hypothetical protein